VRRRRYEGFLLDLGVNLSVLASLNRVVLSVATATRDGRPRETAGMSARPKVSNDYSVSFPPYHNQNPQ
jgi:hypothetical protein